MIVDWLFSMFNSGSGYISTLLAADILLLVVPTYILAGLVYSAFKIYRENVEISSRAWTPPRHPILGHLAMFSPDERGMNTRMSYVTKFRGMTVTWMGFLKVFVEPNSPQTLATALQSFTPKNDFMYRFLRPWIGDGLLTSSGEKWKRHRRLLTHAFHFDILKSYIKVYEQSVSVLVDKWSKRCENDMFDVCSDVTRMTLDVMLQCAMSADTNCQMDSDNKYVLAVHDITDIIVERFHRLEFHVDWLFRLSPTGRRFQKAIDFVHMEAERLIKERRETLTKQREDGVLNEGDSEECESGIRKRKRLDFIDILLRSKDDEGKGLNDAEIRDEVDTFLFEGHDTTSSAISWILYNIARHPDHQKKCRDEIRSVMGDRRHLEFSDLSKLEYLTMCIKESMRIHTPVLSIGRTTTEKMTFIDPNTPNGKLDIGPNTSLLMNLWSMHRNPWVWANPEEYDPNRFSPENVAKMHPMAFVAFSAGPRNCIGKNFAMNEIKVTISTILRKFELYVDEETPKPKMIHRLVLRSENGIYIKIRNLN